MMNEHLHEVLPLNIRPLGDGQRPVEGELDHVVPPYGTLYIMVWVVVPSRILS